MSVAAQETEGYGVPFGFEQYRGLARLLCELKGKAIISLNDHSAIRECFAAYHIEATDTRYAVGGGKGSDAKEVLIFSWDIQGRAGGAVLKFFCRTSNEGARRLSRQTAPSFARPYSS